MKTRVVSAVVGIILLAVVILLYNTAVFPIAVAALCVLAIYEVFSALGISDRVGMIAVSFLYSVLQTIIVRGYITFNSSVLIFIYGFIFVCMFLKSHEKISVYKAGFAFVMTVYVTFGLDSLITIMFRKHGMYLFFATLIIAWINDTGAYFTGCAFGRHKLAPVLSPKKTIEGAVGGVVTVFLVMITYTFVYTRYHALNANYAIVIVTSVIGAVMGIIGDLFASSIKRHSGIKDYGNIMPGHGGVLDRFDGAIMVSIFVMFVTEYFSLIV